MYRRAGVITISLLSIILRTRAPSQTADAQGNGVRISIPGGWQWQTSVAQQGGPILLTTFGTRYDRGGIVPPGGAEIDVTRVSAPAALGDYIRADTLEASIV